MRSAGLEPAKALHTLASFHCWYVYQFHHDRTKLDPAWILLAHGTCGVIDFFVDAVEDVRIMNK
jgi:hypothetical protein